MKRVLLRVLVVAGLIVPLIAGMIGMERQVAFESLARDLVRLIARTWSGDVDTGTLIAWFSIGLVVTWSMVVLSVARAMIGLRRGRVSGSRIGRWLAIAVITGAVPLGETVVSAAESDSVSVVDSAGSEERRDSTGRGVDTADFVTFSLGAGSALVGAGMARRIREIQRRRLRGVEREELPIDIPDDLVEWPSWKRAEELVQRMEAAVALAARSERDARVVQVVVQETGDLLFEFDRVPKLIDPFERVSNRIARLRGSVDLGLSESFESSAVLLHVGQTPGGSVWINLAATGGFSVDDESGESEVVWRALTSGVRLGPFSDRVSIVGSQHDGSFGTGLMTTKSDLANVAGVVSEIGTTLAILESGVDTPVAANVLSLRRGKPGYLEHGLIKSESGWRLMPSGTAIEPVGMADDEIQRVRQLLGDDHHPMVVRERVAVGAPCMPHHALPQWTFLARVMGPPMVTHRTQGRVDFERSKAEELVIWLALHPQQRRRSLARTALWNAAVKDATFSNITAEVRRALSIVEELGDGEHWLGITMTDDLPLNGAVAADSHVLKVALDHARSKPEDDGIGALREGLDLVQGTPFCGSNFIWPDYIGVSSDIAVMIVRASMLMADMCREVGDLEGVYWATAKGLLALPGHEELVAIRMRAHADHGDFTGVRTEWDAYCRAIAADEWRPSEPAPKLVELWRQLGGRDAT